MNWGRQDTVIASTVSAIVAGTFLMTILMSISWASSTSAEPEPISVTPAVALVSDTERAGSGNSEDKSTPIVAPVVPTRASNATNDEQRFPGKVEDVSPIPSPPMQPASRGVAGSSGGSGGGSSGGDDKPTPRPDPKPRDDDETPQEEPGSGKLHGVNFIDPVLNRKEDRSQLSKQTGFVDEFVAKAKRSDFNLFRIPVRWEAYVDNKANFLAELEYLVKTAKENNIVVWIGFHQYDATSNWGGKVSKGGGFPDFVVSCYKPTKGYERDPEVREFWNDYYKNKVRDSSNSCKGTLDVWSLQADFMKDMIDVVDKYSNVMGYELLNEPHVWEDSDYDDLGVLHTELAKKLRKVTDKVLIFTRETSHGLEKDGTKYNRKMDLEYKILPKDPAKNVMYAPHLYDLKEIEEHVADWKDVKKKWAAMGYDVKIAVGEWSPQPPQLPEGKAVTQENMDAYVKVWEREGFLSTYWAYGGFEFGEGNVLVKEIGSLTRAGEYYEKSIQKFYEHGKNLKEKKKDD